MCRDGHHPRAPFPFFLPLLAFTAVISIVGDLSFAPQRPELIAHRYYPTISILMPTYNKGPFISRAIRSALAQTLPSIEVVITDDSSTDETAAHVALFLARDSRVRYFRNSPRLYMNANRFSCLLHSRGNWLLNLDSDDELVNRTAEVDLATARGQGADMVEHKALQYTALHGFEPWAFRPPKFAVGTNATLMRAFWRQSLNWNLWLKLMQRRLYIGTMWLIGPKGCAARIEITVDLLHVGTMYRLVRKFVAIPFIGYIYYRNVVDNSVYRIRGRRRQAHHALVQKLLRAAKKKVIKDPEFGT
jgi:glycosyltransferase involved in cell wall biosynthesis